MINDYVDFSFEKMNKSQKIAIISGFFGMIDKYRDFTKDEATEARDYIKKLDDKVSDKVAFWLDQVALRFNLIRWLSVSDDVNIYINTMISLVNDIDFTKAKGTLVEDYILEVKEANKLDISFKEKIEYIADFQDNLLNLELAETLEDLGYSRDLLITLNNKSVRAAKEA